MLSPVAETTRIADRAFIHLDDLIRPFDYRGGRSIRPEYDTLSHCGVTVYPWAESVRSTTIRPVCNHEKSRGT